MIQTIIALFIVAVALVWVLMTLFKKPKGSGNCSCGCSNCENPNCPTHPKH